MRHFSDYYRIYTSILTQQMRFLNRKNEGPRNGNGRSSVKTENVREPIGLRTFVIYGSWRNKNSGGCHSSFLLRLNILARPPSEVSRKRWFMLTPVSYMVFTTMSKEIRWVSERK